MSKKNWKQWFRHWRNSDRRLNISMTVLNRREEILDKCKLIIDYSRQVNKENQDAVADVDKQYKAHEDAGDLTIEFLQSLDNILSECHRKDSITTIYMDVVKKAQAEMKENTYKITDTLIALEHELDEIIEENNLKDKEV